MLKKKLVIIFVLLPIVIYTSELTEMENACNRGVAEACYELGMIYNGINNLKKDTEKAKIFYEKACDLDYDKACILFESLT